VLSRALAGVLAGALLVGTPAHAADVRVGRSVATSRTVCDWKAYFAGDMRELTSHSEMESVYEPAANPPVKVDGVEFDMARESPIRTKSVARSVARPGDPDFGTIHTENTSTTATGEVIATAFSFREREPRPPLAVGPFDGQAIRLPGRERTVDGRRFTLYSTSRTTAILAILIAPDFAHLLRGEGISETREPGARLEDGSLRVVSADGRELGFYAGDVRRVEGEDFAEPQ